METIDFSAFLCSLVSLSLSLSFNVNVFVKIVCILLEQSGSQSHIHTVEQQQKPKIDRANSSNALSSLSLRLSLCSVYPCLCDIHIQKYADLFSFNWMDACTTTVVTRTLLTQRERKKENQS